MDTVRKRKLCLREGRFVMKSKKSAVWLLSVLCVGALSLGVACGENSAQNGGSSGGQEQPTEIEAVYAQYVSYVSAKNQTPLSYEEWLATIKGEKGDQGEKGEPGVGIEKVEYDKDGNLVIIFTDGSKQTVAMPEKETGGEETTQEGTAGLHYMRIPGKNEYRVVSLGMAAELDIVIPSVYNGLPVTEIGEKAFHNEWYIASVIIPDSVTWIGNYAFYNCSSLTEITIPDSVTGIRGSAFENCSSLQYTVEGNLKYLGNENNPYLYLAGVDFEDITSVTIDKNCKVIGDYAFYNCSSLTEVVIPDSVTSIGVDAFSDCSSLTEVVIGDSVTWIGNYAFYNCSSLAEIIIPDAVTSIGDDAFLNCTSLTIYCEAESEPNGWSYNWNFHACPVVWGYKGE